MQHRMLLDVLIVVTPIALILVPEIIGLIVKRCFNTKEQEV
jgi:hypothetical protein